MRIFVLSLLLGLTLNSVAATGRVFVTNEKGGSVSVIDTKTNQVIKTIAIGERPRGIGLAPDGSAVYVAVSGANHIAVIDPVSLEVKGKFPSGDDPEAFAVHKDGNIYISNEEDAKASVIDPRTGKLVAEIEVGIEPEGVAISPDGTRGIVTSESTNMLHIFSIPEHTVINNILVGARPRAATFSADGKLAYATSEIGGEVKKVDVASGTILGKMALSDDQAKPKDIIVSRDGKRLYVAGGRANRVFVLDSNSLEVITSVPVGKRVWGLALSRDGGHLYTTDGADDQVSVIDTKSDSVTARIAVGAAPWGIVVDD